MTESFLAIFQYPFMQRALVGGVVLGLLLAIVGVFVVLRRMSFFGEGLAHASLAGIAIGILAAFNPLLVAIGLGILFAIATFYLERKTNLSSDVVIGILFTAFMALGVVLMSLKSGYQPELVSFLFGNILTIKTSELVAMIIFAALATLFINHFYRQIAFITFDREGAEVSGIHTGFLDLAFYITLAIATILGVKILGIVLVSALLIIPPSTAKLLAGSFRGLMAASIVVAEIIVIGGIALGFWLNLPTGAIIVLFGAVVFFAVLFGKKLPFN